MILIHISSPFGLVAWPKTGRKLQAELTRADNQDAQVFVCDPLDKKLLWNTVRFGIKSQLAGRRVGVEQITIRTPGIRFVKYTLHL